MTPDKQAQLHAALDDLGRKLGSAIDNLRLCAGRTDRFDNVTNPLSQQLLDVIRVVEAATRVGLIAEAIRDTARRCADPYEMTAVIEKAVSR